MPMLCLWSVCSGEQVVARLCYDRSHYSGPLDCESAEYGGHTATVCYCDTDRCNGAVMTSSFGHVIIMAVLIINVLAGQLL